MVHRQAQLPLTGLIERHVNLLLAPALVKVSYGLDRLKADEAPAQRRQLGMGLKHEDRVRTWACIALLLGLSGGEVRADRIDPILSGPRIAFAYGLADFGVTETDSQLVGADGFSFRAPTTSSPCHVEPSLAGSDN